MVVISLWEGMGVGISTPQASRARGLIELSSQGQSLIESASFSA